MEATTGLVEATTGLMEATTGLGEATTGLRPVDDPKVDFQTLSKRTTSQVQLFAARDLEPGGAASRVRYHFRARLQAGSLGPLAGRRRRVARGQGLSQETPS